MPVQEQAAGPSPGQRAGFEPSPAQGLGVPHGPGRSWGESRAQTHSVPLWDRARAPRTDPESPQNGTGSCRQGSSSPSWRIHAVTCARGSARMEQQSRRKLCWPGTSLENRWQSCATVKRAFPRRVCARQESPSLSGTTLPLLCPPLLGDISAQILVPHRRPPEPPALALPPPSPWPCRSSLWGDSRRLRDIL